MVLENVVTEFSKAFNLKIPIVSAPMWRPASVQLAAAVTAAGGLGMLGAGLHSSETIRDRIAELRHELGRSSSSNLLIGYGFLGWILDLTEPSTSAPGEVWDPRLPTVLDEKPDITWLAFGNDLGRHVAYIRAYQADKEKQTRVFVNVNTVEEAMTAVNEWEVDGIIVQGVEAGGHGSSSSPPLLPFLLSVLEALPPATPTQPRPHILAAGGLTTGEDIAQILLAGADGVVLGTRFLLTDECAWPPENKLALASVPAPKPGEDPEVKTRRTLAFEDVFPNPMKPLWPAHVDGRGVVNQIYRDWEDGMSIEERKRRVKEGMEKGDSEFLILFAGTGAGKVNKIASTKDVMRQLHEETVASLKKASAHHLLSVPPQ